jgi:hypothetical protein
MRQPVTKLREAIRGPGSIYDQQPHRVVTAIEPDRGRRRDVQKRVYVISVYDERLFRVGLGHVTWSSFLGRVLSR